MKLGLSLLAAAGLADEVTTPPSIEPFLAELKARCEEIYGLPFYKVHRKDTTATFKARWEGKCAKQIDRIRNTYENGIGGQGVHQCQSFQEIYRVPSMGVESIPMARDPCNSLLLVTNQINTFTAAFLDASNEHCRARIFKLIARQNKWKDILLSRSDCDSYLYLDSANKYHKISDVCDGDFEDPNDQVCADYAANGECKTQTADWYLARTERSANGALTGLNCPECGCADSPFSLYDVPDVNVP